MTPTESVVLARTIKAHWPHQPIDEYTSDALMETCGRYSLKDLRAAVLALAERGERWCPPTDVKAEVKRIRGRRITAAGPLVPPADLTGPQERAWLAAARRRIGDGEDPATITRPAITGTRCDGLALGQAGSSVDNERAQARAAITDARRGEKPEPPRLLRPEDRLVEPEPADR